MLALQHITNALRERMGEKFNKSLISSALKRGEWPVVPLDIGSASLT